MLLIKGGIILYFLFLGYEIWGKYEVYLGLYTRFLFPLRIILKSCFFVIIVIFNISIFVLHALCAILRNIEFQ